MNRLRGLIFVILLVSALIVLAAGAQEISSPAKLADIAAGKTVTRGPSLPGLSPVNPEFLAYRNRTAVRAGTVSAREGTTIVFNNGSSSHIFLDGEIPSPLDFSYTRGISADMDAVAPVEAVSYPILYDLRTLGRVTPVKDQGAARLLLGLCNIRLAGIIPPEKRDMGLFREQHEEHAGTKLPGRF